jgi:hypothetical protein
MLGLVLILCTSQDGRDSLFNSVLKEKLRQEHHLPEMVVVGVGSLEDSDTKSDGDSMILVCTCRNTTSALHVHPKLPHVFQARHDQLVCGEVEHDAERNRDRKRWERLLVN